MKKIPFVEMRPWSRLTTCPPDGLYAVISYGEHITTRCRRLGLPIVFPWMANIYKFTSGTAEHIGGGTEIADVLSEYDVAKVYLLGIAPAERAELDKMLSERKIELVAQGYTRKVNLTATGHHGCGPDGEDDVYTVEEFKDLCNRDVLIDYDGHGYAVKDNLADPSIMIHPSRLDTIPADATHIVWYNR